LHFTVTSYYIWALIQNLNLILKDMLKKFLVLPALLLVLTTTAYADVCNPDDPDFNQSICDGPGSGTQDTPAGAPIDGGASILLASGAGIALKKLRDSRKKK
jgi:hypothetical protein